MTISFYALIAAAFPMLAIAGEASAAPEATRAGTLTCTAVAPEAGSGQLSCTFEPSIKESVSEYYAGRIPDANLGMADKTIVVWTVWSRAASVPPGALEGEYVASPERTTGSGAFLAGRNLTLEPLTAAPGTSPNVAGKIGELTLVRNRPRV